MHNEQLQEQLAAYAGFLDEVSRERVPDFRPMSIEIEGDVTVVELMTRGSDEEVGGRGSPNGRWSSRTPWLVAVAAAVALLAALAFLIPGGQDGSLETIEPPEQEVEPTPVEVEPVPESVAVDPPLTLGERLQEATSLESTELLADIYSPGVSVSVDGVDLDGTGIDPFEFVTDMSMAELLDVRYTDCVGDAASTIECNWSLDFTLLDGTVPTQRGTATLETVDEEITSVDMRTDNLDEVVSGLALYRGWVDATFGDADQLFTPVGTLAIHPLLAELHAAASTGFLAATDVAADPANVGAVVMAAMRASDDATNGRIYSPLVTWTENPGGTLGSDETLAVFAGPVFAELALFEIHTCARQSGATFLCRFDVSYPLVPALEGVLGEMEITVAPDGLVEAIELDLEDPAWTEHTQALLDYQEWLTAEFSATDPDIVDRMFWQPTHMAGTAESVELHREHGPNWSLTYLE